MERVVGGMLHAWLHSFLGAAWVVIVVAVVAVVVIVVPLHLKIVVARQPEIKTVVADPPLLALVTRPIGPLMVL